SASILSPPTCTATANAPCTGHSEYALTVVLAFNGFLDRRFHKLQLFPIGPALHAMIYKTGAGPGIQNHRTLHTFHRHVPAVLYPLVQNHEGQDRDNPNIDFAKG